MARFREETALNASFNHVRDLLGRAAADLDLIVEEDSRGHMVLKEKYRFDHYNQVELDVEMVDLGSDCRISVDGQNQGPGNIQLGHVRSKVLEVLSRIQIDLEYVETMEPDLTDPSIIREMTLISDLHERGILTDYEYRSAKRRLLEK